MTANHIDQTFHYLSARGAGDCWSFSRLSYGDGNLVTTWTSGHFYQGYMETDNRQTQQTDYGQSGVSDSAHKPDVERETEQDIFERVQQMMENPGNGTHNLLGSFNFRATE